MFKKIKFIVVTLNLVIVPIINAQDTTFIQGSIAQNTTWTIEGNPYIVIGDVTVLPNVNLSIDSGVVVKFSGYYKIRIAGGQLMITGTDSSKVIFTSNQPTPSTGDWNTIFFDADSYGEISNAIIEYSNKGISTDNTSPVISDCEIRNNLHGIYIEGTESHPTISKCTIFSNQYGIYSYLASWGFWSRITVSECIVSQNTNTGINNEYSYFLIQNCIISKNTVYGIRSWDDEINHNTITSNGIGISTNERTASITYNTIRYNEIGVKVGKYPSGVTINNNNLYGSSSYDAVYQGGYDDGEVDATNNWWGTTDVDSIAAHIYDIFDDSNLNGWFNFQPFLEDSILVTVIDDGIQVIPFNFSLYQNYPNPFNLSTKILYSIPNSDFVTLKIYDVLGVEVKALISDFQNKGMYSINFDASKLSSGIYFYKLQVGNNFVETKKMMLIR